jgi:acetoin utilization deacetylase AcuC-like enzyme
VPEDLTAQLGFYSFAIDCSIVEGTWRAIRSSAQLAQSATHAVIGGERVAFGLCRPPGHHATADQFGGYCYLNNAAIAAQQFLDSGKARVAVVDVDYHHGNGTQSIFYERDDVVFCSIHADPRQEFPYFSGYADETGRGDGEGFNHNEPLVLGTGFDAWSAALDRCLARLTDLGCDAMIVSLGVDTFELDPISTFTLTHDDYPKMGEQLASVGLPTSILLEGGYAVEDIGINVAGVLQGFENR